MREFAFIAAALLLEALPVGWRHAVMLRFADFPARARELVEAMNPWCVAELDAVNAEEIRKRQVRGRARSWK